MSHLLLRLGSVLFGVWFIAFRRRFPLGGLLADHVHWVALNLALLSLRDQLEDACRCFGSSSECPQCSITSTFARVAGTQAVGAAVWGAAIVQSALLRKDAAPLVCASSWPRWRCLWVAASAALLFWLPTVTGEPLCRDDDGGLLMLYGVSALVYWAGQLTCLPILSVLCAVYSSASAAVRS